MEQERQPKTVVYLSGRITGLPITYVREFFEQAEKHYTSEGYKVLNPLRNGLTEGTTWEQHMAKDIIMLQRADIIALLPGWRNSTGAQLEHEIAKVMNMGVMYYEPTEKIFIGIEIIDLPEFADTDFRSRVAKMENLTPELVNILSMDKFSVVRWAIAKRPDLTAEQVERLSKDEVWDVRWEIAIRPDLTPEQVDRLSKDEHWGVRWETAERADLTPEQVERLSKDEDRDVRWAITSNKIKRSTK